MGKTPCGKGFIGSNAASASINTTIKKVLGITVEAFANFWGRNSMTDIQSRSFGSNISWFCKNDTDLLNVFNKNSPFSKLGLLGRLQTSQHSEYEGYFSAIDAAFRNGRVASAQKGSKTCWKNWCSFVRPLGVEPWLQNTTYQQQVRCLAGFTACVLSGRYG